MFSSNEDPYDRRPSSFRDRKRRPRLHRHRSARESALRPAPSHHCSRLGKHLFLPVYALQTKGVGTTFARSSFVDLGKFRIPLRPDNNSMLHYIDLKIIRDEKPVGARTGSALVAEVVSGERMGVGTALSAGVSPSGIETSGADKVRDLFPKGSDSNKVKSLCNSPDKAKKTPSCSKYGSSSTGSSGGRERKIHENSRFKFNRRGNYRSRG